MRTSIAWSSPDLVNQYNYLSSGHFFDPDTMRFFRSRITDNFERIDDKTALFITTEKGPSGDSKRLATIRRADLVEYKRERDGRICYKITIETVGEFNNLSLYTAKKALEVLASEIKRES
jgi:hypothetical protein